MRKKEDNSEVKYVPFTPMSDEEKKEIFADIHPESIHRFVLTEVEKCKEALLSSRSMEDIEYQKGKIEGIQILGKLATKVAKERAKVDRQKDAKEKQALKVRSTIYSGGLEKIIP